MNYLKIKASLEKTLQDLIKKLDYWKKLRENKESTTNIKQEANHHYDLTLKKFFRISELLSILEYIRLQEASSLEIKGYQKETVDSLETLIKLLRQDGQSLETINKVLHDEKSNLERTIDATELAKEKFKKEQRIKKIRNLISAIESYKRAFNICDSKAIIAHMQSISQELQRMSANDFKKHMMNRIDKSLKEKLDLLTCEKTASMLEINITKEENNPEILSGIVNVAQEFLGKYHTYQSSRNARIETEKLVLTPMVFQGKIYELEPVTMGNIEEYLETVKNILSENEDLQKKFLTEEMPRIQELLKPLTVKYVEQNYLRLLEEYQDKGVFTEEFIIQKRRNFDEYLGKLDSRDLYYRGNKIRMLQRLGTDIMEIKRLIIDYLIKCGDQYGSIGITSTQIRKIFEENNNQKRQIKKPLQIKKIVTEFERRIKIYCSPCVDYYNDMLELKELFQKSLDSNYTQLMEIADRFMLIVQEEITPEKAMCISNMNKVRDIIADVYQREVFEKTFSSYSNNDNKKFHI